MGFVVIRLGKDSVADIEHIDAQVNGIKEPFDMTFTCKQVEESIATQVETEDVYAFIYLGSDNNKGIPTKWKKGIRALGRITNIEGRESFQSECRLKINIFSIFPESYDSVVFLEKNAELYKSFSNYPVIGLQSSRNNSIQKVNEGVKQNTAKLLSAITSMNPRFRFDLSIYAPPLVSSLEADMIEPEGDDKHSDEVMQSEGWGDEYPLNTVLVRTEQRTVENVVDRINKGRYKLDPDFQRDFVWKVDKQSKLIESCLMRIPLPVFYVAEDQDGRVVIVDGLQRLTTFVRYKSNQFALKGIGSSGREESIEGRKFADLPLKLQERIDDTQLTLYILDEKAPERAKLDVFDRVNGGVPLTRQQMRNCLYNGSSTRLLKKMSLSDVFVRATGKSLVRETFKDREVINRFCAFYILKIDAYKGDMDDFLARSLKAMNKLDSDDLRQIENVFENAMKVNFELFGPHAFRKSLSYNPTSAARSVINISLFDVCSVLLADVPLDKVETKKSQLKRAIVSLLSDASFDEAISIGTNSTKKVNLRFTMMEERISGVLHC